MAISNFQIFKHIFFCFSSDPVWHCPTIVDCWQKKRDVGFGCLHVGVHCHPTYCCRKCFLSCGVFIIWWHLCRRHDLNFLETWCFLQSITRGWQKNLSRKGGSYQWQCSLLQLFFENFTWNWDFSRTKRIPRGVRPELFFT